MTYVHLKFMLGTGINVTYLLIIYLNLIQLLNLSGLDNCHLGRQWDRARRGSETLNRKRGKKWKRSGLTEDGRERGKGGREKGGAKGSGGVG